MTTTTRRNIIAGAAALPLLPATALAVPVTLPLLPVSAFATPDDPAVAAFAEWKTLDRERTRITSVFNALEDKHGPSSEQAIAYENETVAPIYVRLGVVDYRIAEMIATTPAGLAGQARIAMELFGLDGPDGRDEVEGRLLLAMLAGAEGMANA